MMSIRKVCARAFLEGTQDHDESFNSADKRLLGGTARVKCPRDLTHCGLHGVEDRLNVIVSFEALDQPFHFFHLLGAECFGGCGNALET